MNTDTTVSTPTGQSGRWVVRVCAAMTVALLLLGVTLHAGNAQQHGSAAQLRFQGQCVRSGGVLTQGAEGNAGWTRCTWRNPDGSGTSIDCEFTGPYLGYCTGTTHPPAKPSVNQAGNAALSGKQLTAIRLQAANEGTSLDVDSTRR